MEFKAGIILALVLLPSFVYLVVRATDDYSWDNWGFGSAQTMLTIRHWVGDGFINNKLLFIPSGYFEGISFLDLPEFRFLSSGIRTGGLIGTRLYYTHYPSGYYFPYAVLAKTGLDDRMWLRILATVLSFGSVLLLYGFIYVIAEKNHWIALISALYYATSKTFLAYADSLANMPVDDLLKYSVLLASVYSVRARKLIWPLFFLLSISSYDSTMFVLFWLCAFDLINTKKIRLSSYLYFFSAPLAAFLIQIAQNYWYLGFDDMLNDLLGTLLGRVNQSQGILENYPAVVRNLVAALSPIGYLTDLRTRMALPIIIAIIYILRRLGHLKNLMPYLVALLGAGLMYGLVMPIVGGFGYQGRQMTLFLLPIIAMATKETVSFFVSQKRKLFQPSILVLFIMITTLWVAHAKAAVDYVEEWPSGGIVRQSIDFWKELAEKTSGNTIILGIDKNLASGTDIFFAQYYADRLILTFPNIATLQFYKKRMERILPPSTEFFIHQ